MNASRITRSFATRAGGWIASLGLIVCSSAALAGEPCEPHWDNNIGDPGVGPNSLNSSVPRVSDLVVFDDGNGSALYACGDFVEIGGVTVNGVAKWDGTAWSALGGGMDHRVSALEVFDDGSGPAIFAGGIFLHVDGEEIHHLAKWDGTQWVDIGADMEAQAGVLDLHVLDDGSGPALFIGGDFSTIGGIQANGIAKWDGTTWSALGLGVDVGVLYAMIDYDDGNGSALYLGGDFDFINGNPANCFAKWDGASLSAVGGPLTGGVRIRAFEVMPTKDGSVLVVGGRFVSGINGIPNTDHIAIWNGAAWSSFSEENPSSEVVAMKYFDAGSGPSLYVGGEFHEIGDDVVRRIARWDGNQWHALGQGAGSGLSAVYALCAFDDGTGSRLVVAGRRADGGGSGGRGIVTWGCVDDSACPSDFVTSKTFQPPGDGVTDGADLAYLLGEWGEVSGGGSLADIVTSKTFQPPPDGVVDGADLAVLLGAWGLCG